jgi:hypothetical protein
MQIAERPQCGERDDPPLAGAVRQFPLSWFSHGQSNPCPGARCVLSPEVNILRRVPDERGKTEEPGGPGSIWDSVER